MFFFKKRMLLIAGPSGCGKSTFIRSITDHDHTSFVKEVLRESFSRDRLSAMTKRLRLSKLRKIYAEQNSFTGYLGNFKYFLLHVDTMGPNFKKNMLLLPDLFLSFDIVASVQICTPFDVWRQRNIERIEEKTQKPSRLVKRILKLSSSSNRERKREAESIYAKNLSNWESFLTFNGISNQIRVDTINELILASRNKH